MARVRRRRHMTKHPIFFDPNNRRAGHVSRIAWALAVTTSIAGLVFLSSLFIFRSFPETLQTSQSQRYPLLNDVAKVPHLLPSVRNLARKAQSTKKQYPHAVPPPAVASAKTKAVKISQRAPREAADNWLLCKLGRQQLFVAQKQPPKPRLGRSELALSAGKLDGPQGQPRSEVA